MAINWQGYKPADFYDELIEKPGKARPSAQQLVSYFQSLDDEEVERRREAAEATVREMGVTFTVYTDEGNIDRAWPFDIIPRTISKKQWDVTAEGLKQRLQALNLFITDLYHDQKIVRDGVLPRYILDQSKNFRPECVGIMPRYGVWANICGTDLVRDKDGEFYVLEDNLRVHVGEPSYYQTRAS
jgi:uncharacterized circularly permuted ATP-grasp superfamily protein